MKLSLRRGSWLAVLMLIAACSSTPPQAPRSYTVKSGDTLYSIATRYGLDYRELARVNGIGNDYRIDVGQVLRLSATTPAAVSGAITKRTPDKALPANTIRWRWPTSAASYSVTLRPNGGRGLSIVGTLGQEVRAAAAGKIVYTGSGLLGYGQLVIIKHDETYLSAYGHTQTVLVREGQQVNVDQPIATMGTGPAGTPLLYFEIRANGQPLDALSLLLQQQ